jgi:hypothetical protein
VAKKGRLLGFTGPAISNRTTFFFPPVFYPPVLIPYVCSPLVPFLCHVCFSQASHHRRRRRHHHHHIALTKQLTPKCHFTFCRLANKQTPSPLSTLCTETRVQTLDTPYFVFVIYGRDYPILFHCHSLNIIRSSLPFFLKIVGIWEPPQLYLHRTTSLHIICSSLCFFF